MIEAGRFVDAEVAPLDPIADAQPATLENGRVRVPEAFRAMEDWDQLMDTLDEISRYPAPETFDLFCGALLAYHELVEPEPA